MKYKCTLLIDEKTIDATYDIRNWDEIQASFKREGYGGVVRSFTNKFQFVGVSRLALLEKFSSDYLTSSAKITIYTKNASWGYDERFSCGMDFASLSDDGNTLSMNALDNDVAAIIKAKKGVEYEYDVESLKDGTLKYDGVEIQSFSEWQITGTSVEDSTDTYISIPNNFNYVCPLYIIKSEQLNRSKIYAYDTPLAVIENSTVYYGYNFIESARDVEIELKVTAKGYTDIPYYSAETILVYIYRYSKEGTYIDSKEVYRFNTISEEDSTFSIDFSTSYELKSGEKLCMVLTPMYTSYTEYHTITITESSVRVDFKDRIQPVDFDIISPATVLDKLLSSMNDNKDDIKGQINGDTKLKLTMICPAESIRGIPGAKIYTSFTKFCEWMEAVFGYIYEIQDRKVIFKHRASLFSHDVVKEVDRYNGYGLSIDNSLVFSQVNIGYEKQDYESVNGRDEFNFTNQYSTGVLNTESKLELISPYRADCYGIEFLAQKRGEDTTDNESDKDVFFIGVVYDSEKGVYAIDRSKDVQNVASPDTIFNAMYSPSQMAEENKYYIGACTRKLTFASSDGNSDAIIGGEAENRDIDIDLKLFSAKVVQFETSDIAIPSDLNGTVLLHYKGGDIRGFLMEADYTYTKTQSSKIKLLVE